MIRTHLSRWLLEPPVTGWSAVLCGIGIVALPTIIRADINDIITGCEFTPYLPFVFLAALLLRWWNAAAIALVSAATLGTLFIGQPIELFNSSCFLSSSGIFLAASGAMIGSVILVRSLVAAIHRRGADESEGGIVFSLERGEVWASWYGQGPAVLLGSQEKVSGMMEDFLAQEELGKRLNGHP